MKFLTVIKILSAFLISFSVIFSCIGFAQLSDDLTVGGQITVEEQKGVYIYNIELLNNSDVRVNSYISTVLNSTATLQGSSSSSAIIKVTVKNNSDLVYGYSATLRQAGIDPTTYSNADIAYGVYSNKQCTTPLAKRTAVQPDGYLDFYVKFYYTDDASIDSAGESLNSVLNFKFITPIDDIPETGEAHVILDAMEKFKIILNTPNEYADLYNGMQAKYDGKDWHVSYIGNVAGSAHRDTAVLNDLFDNILTINVDGTDLNITLIAKMENIDGKTSTGASYSVPSSAGTTYSGCEFTLYMTAKQIKQEGYDTFEYIETVYAGVFTRDSADSKWYQLGEIYNGKAQCVGYVGGYDNDSFDTGTWRSTKSYYSTGTSATISSIIQKRYTSKTALRTQINAASSLSQSNYTSESWDVLKEALTLARSTYNSSSATQALVVTRTKELQKAIDNLVSQVE